MAHPVFYDPKQARHKKVRRIFDVAAISLTLLLAFFIYTALRSEPLPDLLWPTEKHGYRAHKEKEKEKAKEKRRQAAIRRGHKPLNKPPSQIKLNTEEGVRAASMCNGTPPASPHCVRMPGRS